MRRNLPGLAGLGMTESGEVWKGPRRASTSAQEAGPMYLPRSNSIWTLWLYSSEKVSIDDLLAGAKVLEIAGIPTSKPCSKSDGRVGYWWMRPVASRCHLHASALYGLPGLCCLSSRALLSSMRGLSASRALVFGIVGCAGASRWSLPVGADDGSFWVDQATSFVSPAMGW